MIELELTKEIHGEQLQKEIGCDNLYIANNKIVIVGDVTQEFAQAKYDSHIPIYPQITEPTIADKLASVGLSLDELKAAILGGN